MTREVQNNGPGIEPASWQQPNQRSSFGKRLITSLSEQRNGHVSDANGGNRKVLIQRAEMAYWR